MRIAAIAVLGWLAVIAAGVGLTSVDVDWLSWEPATCMPRCFCEAIHASTVRQPMNTWSSSLFCLVAFGVFGAAAKDRGSQGQITVSASMLYGFALLLTGVGSMFYHASLSFVGQWLDVMGMYLLVLFVLLDELNRRLEWRPLTFGGVYGAAICASGVLLTMVPATRRYVFAALVISTLIVIIIMRGRALLKTPYLAQAVAMLAAACAAWLADITGAWCDPYSLLQGHALWHTLCAATTLLIYFDLRASARASGTRPS